MRCEVSDPAAGAEASASGYAYIYRRQIEQRAKGDLPDDRFIDVRYADLLADPGGTVEAIYAALGVPEIWRFDGYTLTIYHLQENHYLPHETSLALSILNSRLLTDLLTRLSQDGEFQTLLAFDEWLQSQTSDPRP